MRTLSIVALTLLGITAYGMIPIAFTCAPGPLGYCGNNYLWSALLILLGVVGFVLALIASVIGIVRALKRRQWRWALWLFIGGLLALPAGILLSAIPSQVLGANAVAPLLVFAAGLLLTPAAAYLYGSRYPLGAAVVKPPSAFPAGATETMGQLSYPLSETPSLPTPPVPTAPFPTPASPDLRLTGDGRAKPVQARKRPSRARVRTAFGVIVLIATVFDSILATYDTIQRVHVRFEVSPVVQSYCRDLEKRDYTAASELLSSSLTISADPGEFVTLDSKYGAVQSCSLQGVTSDGFGPSIGYIGAQAYLQIMRQDTCTLILDLSQEGNNWVIEEFGTSGGFTANFGVPNCEGDLPPPLS